MQDGRAARRLAARGGDLIGHVVQCIALKHVIGGVAQADAGHPVKQRAARGIGHGVLTCRIQRRDPRQLRRCVSSRRIMRHVSKGGVT